MSTKPLILVTSAAGKTGRMVVHELRMNGYPVRAFVRQRDERAERLEQAGAELFVGDQYALSDMRLAMRDVARAYQCAPSAPNGLLFNTVFAVAAQEAGLEHVAVLSQWLSAVDHPALFTRETYLADRMAQMSPTYSVTTINPGWFADNYFMVIKMAAHLGLFAMPLGAGDVPKNAPPSSADIARVAAAALMDPEHHAGQTYRPTGPELMSPNDLANAMGRVLGRRVVYRDISEKMMTKALRAIPPANYSEAAVTQLAIYADEYRRGTFAVNAPTDHVFKVVGQNPESFEQILRGLIAERPDLKPSLRKTIGAVFAFLKIALTPALNLKRAQQQRDYAEPANPKFSQDSEEWRQSHLPARFENIT